MKIEMYRSLNKKIFHAVMIIIIIFVILCVAGILVLRYQVEGETNMPFKIEKISIIESVEGIESSNPDTANSDTANDKWNLKVNQNNDIYIYIEKNSGYGKTEIIESVEINNIVIEKKNQVGETKIYKPVTDEKRMFNNLQENEITNITYTGELQSNMKEQKISNQGGIIAFRYAINNISEYISNEDEEIDHSKLLQLTNIKQEDLETRLNFNVIIKLTSGKKYQTTISLDIPSDEIIEKGTIGIEETELENIIFKRIEN